MRWAAICVSVAALAGCDCGEGGGADGSLDGGGDGASGFDTGFDAVLPDVGTEAQEAIDLTLDSECRYAVLCTDSASLHRLACHPSDREEARAARVRAVARGDLRADPAASAACRTTAEATTCEAADPDCGALTPARTAGETCGHPDACVEGFCTGVSCPTICEIGLGDGDACNSPSDCARRLTCREGSCALRVTEGEACSGPLDCEEGMVCDETCLAVVEASEGEDCDGFVTLCPRHLHCVGGTCVRGGVPGDPCDFDNPCQLEASCEAGACIERVLPGSPCDDTVLCPRSHACVGGSCVPRPIEGDACTSEPACLEGACVGGLCAFEESPGACTFGTECRSRLCVRDVCQSVPALGERCIAGCAPGGECRFVPGEPRLCRPICR